MIPKPWSWRLDRGLHHGVALSSSERAEMDPPGACHTSLLELRARVWGQNKAVRLRVGPDMAS